MKGKVYAKISEKFRYLFFVNQPRSHMPQYPLKSHIKPNCMSGFLFNLLRDITVQICA